MKKRFILRSGAALTAISILSTSAQAQTFFSSALDSSTGWNINASAGNHIATFGFDYSALGIPASPNGGGSTIGLRLQANAPTVPPAAGVFGGISVSPTGQAFVGDFQLRYDLWQNFPGPYPAGGAGSTQLSGGGIGTAGTTPQWAGAAYDSLFFLASGDGGSGSDYRVYPVANAAAAATGYYAAGSSGTPSPLDSAHPYYASFGGNTAPAIQGQTGTTAVGTQGMEWHDVAITKVGSTVTWEIDGVLIATVDAGALTFGGDNIALIQSDINAGQTDAAGGPILFGVYDNVRVTVVPEPTSAALMAVAGALLLARRRKD